MEAEKVLEMFQKQMEAHKLHHQQQMDVVMHLVKSLDKSASTLVAASTSTTPNLVAFVSNSELWEDYWSRFNTFVKAHAVPEERQAQVFLTNQSATIYKLLSNLAAQNSPAKQVNDLSIKEIAEFMNDQ